MPPPPVQSGATPTTLPATATTNASASKRHKRKQSPDDNFRPDPAYKRVKLSIPVRRLPPRYVPGSVPPPPRPTLLPRRDKASSTTFIAGKVLDPVIPFGGSEATDRKLCYIVGWTDLPAARIAVPCQRILEWVSPWVLEEWEYQDAVRREEDKERKEEEEALRLVAEMEAKEAGTVVKSHPTTLTKNGKRRGRPPKSQLSEMAPVLDAEEELGDGLASRSGKPSLMTLQKRDISHVLEGGNVTYESDDVGDEKDALQRQLADGAGKMPLESRGDDAGRGLLWIADIGEETMASGDVTSTLQAAASDQASGWSTFFGSKAEDIITSKPLPKEKKPKQAPKSRGLKSLTSFAGWNKLGSREKTIESADDGDLAHENLVLTPAVTQSGDQASKRKAPALASPMSPFDEPASKRSKPWLSSLTPDLDETTVGSTVALDQALDGGPEQDEWTIMRIEDDIVDENGIHFFLVRWVGNWPPDQNPTWEPEENIDHVYLKRYLQRKAFKGKKKEVRIEAIREEAKARKKPAKMASSLKKKPSAVTPVKLGSSTLGASYDKLGATSEPNALPNGVMEVGASDDGSDDLLLVSTDLGRAMMAAG